MTATSAPHKWVQNLPTGPGVYQMLDTTGSVIYVGKAKNLRQRVKSHFQNGEVEPKTRAMVGQVHDVQVTLTHTETEALLLESNLIKRHRPRYNVLFRDDKSYPYIFLSKAHPYPRLALHRGPQREPGRYFGPYPSARAVRETLQLLHKIFPVRQCEDSFFAHRARPCLQYQIQRCSGPCTGMVGITRYQEYVREVELFLEGRNRELTEGLSQRMEQASAEMRFEEAAWLRDQIRAIRRIQEHQHISGGSRDHDIIAVSVEAGVACVQVFFIRGGRNLGNREFFPRHTAGLSPEEILEAFLPQFYIDKPAPPSVIISHPIGDPTQLASALSERMGHKVTLTYPQRGEKRHWIAMALHNAESALQRRLSEHFSHQDRSRCLAEALELDTPPERIECFDISHTQGEGTVASCVVFDQEGPRKGDYRRFNISEIDPGDDYGALKQVLTRRYQRLKREETPLPDLVVVDGGPAQLKVAEQVFEELQMTGVALISIAKGEARRPGEELIWPAQSESPIRLDPHAKALHLLQWLRDEAHRFALFGHRRRRGKARQDSALDAVSGIGKKRKKTLLQHFGGLQGVRTAGVEDLLAVPGINRALAERIYLQFHS